MGRVRRIIGGNRVIRRLRYIAETLFTPRVRADLATQQVHLTHLDNVASAGSERAADLLWRLEQIERHLPQLLNVIASGDGASRVLRREFDEAGVQIDGRMESLDKRVVELADRIDGSVQSLAARIDLALADTEQQRPIADTEIDRRIGVVSGSVSELAESVAGHVDTQRWLLDRVEMVRAEMLHELRYGKNPSNGEPGEIEIIDPAALSPDDGAVRLNLGCGHKPLEGFANVDMRKIPGVDVVAPVDELPAEVGSLAEIFSSHLLEHFPEEQLRRRLLPYWVGLLRPGGTFRAVVPDMGAMIAAAASGDLDFATFRSVTYGGQEYEGDAHFNGFTAEHLASLLEEAGLTDIEVLATGRPEGDCLELEISATRPL